MKIFSKDQPREDYVTKAQIGGMLAGIFFALHTIADNTIEKYEDYSPAEKRVEFTEKAVEEAMQSGSSYYIDELNMNADQMMSEFEDKAKAKIEDAKLFKAIGAVGIALFSLFAVHQAAGAIIDPKARSENAKNQPSPKPGL